MKILKYIIFLFIILLSVRVFATDYYVDPDCATPGDGTTTTCDGGADGPFDDFTNDVTPSCGDTVYIKKGSVLRDSILVEDLTCTNGNEFTIDDYGSGDIPEVTSRHRSQAAWVGPVSGVYHYDTGVGSLEGFWVGIDGTDEWGAEIPEDTDGGTSPSDGYWSHSGSTIYFNPSVTQDDPDDANFYFEWSASESAHGLSGIYIDNSHYIIIRDINSNHSRYHGLVISESTYISVYDSNFDYNGISTSYFSPDGNSLGNGIECNNAGYVNVYDSTGSFNFDNGLGLEAAWDSGGDIGPINFWRCTGEGNGGSGGWAKNRTSSSTQSLEVNFYECEFTNNGNLAVDSNHYSYSGIKYSEDTHGTVQNCYIHDNLGAGIQLYNNEENGWTTLIYGNLIIGNATGNTTGWGATDRGSIEDGGIVIRDNYGNSGESVRIYNDTIADNTLYGIYQTGGGTFADFYMYNNIVTGNTSQDVRLESDSFSKTIDTNLYSASLSNYLGATNYTSISIWNAISGIGTDLSGDPYLDANYFPLSNSPAIDAGTNLGASYDDVVLSGSSWTDSVTTGVQGDYGLGWDIGFGVTSGISAPVISGQGPTSTQTCDGTTSTDEIYLDTDRDSTCRASRKGTHTCATAYASLDVEMTDEGGNHHTFTGSGSGEPGYQVTCGDTETIVAICQDDLTSEYSNCVEWSYQVNPPSVGAIAQRHPVAWTNIAQIHPVAVANIAQIHPIGTAEEAGEVECDDCSGDLMFSWHMENNDSTPDVTVHDSIDDPCGCSDGDTIGDGTATPVFDGTEKSDGSYSLAVDGLDDRYDFDVSAKDIVDPDNIKLTFDIYVVAYPSSAGNAEVIRASYNADNNFRILLNNGGTISGVHRGAADSDTVEISVATGSWVSCEYQAKQGVAGNDHYLICGVTSDEDDDDMTAMAASMNYLQIGDHYGTVTATYYIDNVKIYPCDKY